MGFSQIINGLVAAVSRLSPAVAACAAAGLVIGGLSITGLSSKLISLVNVLTMGLPLLAVLISAVILLVLGLGMPVPTVYVIAASLIAPMLNELGCSVLQVHLFIVFYCALASITPPEAAAAFTAAGIADADPMQVGWLSCRFAIGGYLVPIFFMFNPGLLLIGSWGEVLRVMVTITLALFFLSAAFEGYFRGKLGTFSRLLAAAGALLLIIPGITINLIGFVMGGMPLMPNLWKRWSLFKVTEEA
jgi:TRAP-type uncharacterized transport system fused permease subunit